MKKRLLHSPIRNFRKAFPLLAVSFFIWFLAFANNAFAQSPEIIKALETVAKYHQADQSLADQLLDQYGYRPPEYLGDNWRALPAYGKIQMAYKAAENAQPGGGDRLLALLAQDLSRQYESVRYERPLEQFFVENATANAPKIMFKNPADPEKVAIPQTVKQQIAAISKYCEGGALGGPHNILRNYFELDNLAVYDILGNSKSAMHALEQGIQKVGDESQQMHKIRTVAKDIYENYESARSDQDILDILDEDLAGGNGSGPAKPNKPIGPEGTPINRTGGGGGGTAPRNSGQYGDFFRNNYRTPQSRGFGSAINNPSGFGGIILGDSVKVAPRVEKPVRLLWVPYNNPEGLANGYLEILFESGVTCMARNILKEDVFACIGILTDSEFPYTEGNFIGLVSVNNPKPTKEYYYDWELVIHPAVANLSLAYAIAVGDILFTGRTELYDRFRNSSNARECFNLLNEFNRENLQTWKISDVKTTIVKNGNLIEVVNNDPAQKKDIYITMHGFKSMYANKSEESPAFKRLMPAVISAVPEYRRLNGFIRTLAILRWANANKAKLPEIKTYDRFIEKPSGVKITLDGHIKF